MTAAASLRALRCPANPHSQSFDPSPFPNSPPSLQSTCWRRLCQTGRGKAAGGRPRRAAARARSGSSRARPTRDRGPGPPFLFSWSPFFLQLPFSYNTHSMNETVLDKCWGHDTEGSPVRAGCRKPAARGGVEDKTKVGRKEGVVWAMPAVSSHGWHSWRGGGGRREGEKGRGVNDGIRFHRQYTKCRVG